MYFGCSVWLLKQLFGEGLQFLKKKIVQLSIKKHSTYIFIVFKGLFVRFIWNEIAVT